MNNKLYIATIFNYIQRLHILNWKGITYHIYSNNIKQYLKMNSYINLLPVGQTPCPLFLLLPQQHRVLPVVFFFFPKTATPRRCSDAVMQPSVFFPIPWRRSLSHSDYWTTICYLPPGTAPKMKIIDSGNGQFLQQSLFLKAFERVTDSQVCFKSSRVFLKFS